MYATLLVAAGGAVGSVARYWVGIAAASLWGAAFPWGTLLINVLGSCVIGVFAALTLPETPTMLPADLHDAVRSLVMVGFCGGFTTFSSFSLQTLALLQGGDWPAAAANVVVSVALCLAAVALGHVLGTRFGIVSAMR